MAAERARVDVDCRRITRRDEAPEEHGPKGLEPRQQVEETLRKPILNGQQLRVTERLQSESELARQFSVSRPTIREALSALESQGLIYKFDDPLIADLDTCFHVAIGRMSGNRILASLIYTLHSESEPVAYLSPDVGRETFAQHRAIVKAIADQDPESGKQAITAHLTYLREHLKAHADALQANA